MTPRKVFTKPLVAVLCGLAVIAFGSPAWAHWQPGDGHKMHFPQLPDSTGWDVKASGGICLADDWQCSETGYVGDIHFWGSWKNGIVGQFDWV